MGVVVLNWCAAELTAECVRSLLASDYPQLRLLLVDNGSPDGSGERLEEWFPDIPFLQTGENLGYTGGNNRGIDRVLDWGVDYVLVLNNDTVVESDTVRKLVEAADGRDRIGAVAPKIFFFDDPERIWFGGGALSRVRAIGRHLREGEVGRRGDDEPIEAVTFLSGCCLLLPADVVRAMGGFTEDLFAYVEDVDLSIRLNAAGYELLYQPAARILHHVQPSQARPSPFQILMRDRNRRRVVRRRYGLLGRVAFTLFFFPSRIYWLGYYLLAGDRARARAIWQGMTVA